PADEVLSHLVYAASGKDISDVIINGKRVVWNGECKTLDEERIWKTFFRSTICGSNELIKLCIKN
ncbi:hypothetical protein, partial [Bacillus cereus]